MMKTIYAITALLTNRFARRISLLIALAAIVVLERAHPSVHAATLRTVAVSGQSAPGTPSGVIYGGFGYAVPALNDAGQTAFYGTLSGSDVNDSNNQGIWSEGSGSLALVARSGSQAPGMPGGVNYSGFGSPLLNDAGQSAFFAVLPGIGPGIWSESSGSPALVARVGGTPPGFSFLVTYREMNSPVLNDSGQTAFSALLTGAGVFIGATDLGIWAQGSGSLALVALAGSPAPGTPNGVKFAYSTPISGIFQYPRLNNAGQVAFDARLTGSGVNGTNNSGIWSEGSGSLALVARGGSPAPGTPGGVNFSFFNSPALNDAGQTAFQAYVTGSGVDSTNEVGIWSEDSGSLALVARSGNPAPGTPGGVNYKGLNSPVLNNAGQTAFLATLTGSGVVEFTNDAGIWSEGSGSLALVARSGNPAPSTPSGVNFSGFIDPVLNDAGQAAFFAYLAGSGVDSSNGQGIWATDRNHALQLIARRGDPLEVAPGDFRTISALGFAGGAGNNDGRSSGFNNLGQLAFFAAFSDGSAGIFVSNVVAVPEPSALALAVVGVLGAMARRAHSAWKRQ